MVGDFCCNGGGTKVRCYEPAEDELAGKGETEGRGFAKKGKSYKRRTGQTMGIKHFNMKVFVITILLAFVATTYAGYISSGWSGGGGGWNGGGGGGGWKGGWNGGGGGWNGGGGGGKIIKVITVGGGGGGWPSGGGGGWPSGGGGWSGGGGGGGWKSGWSGGGGGGWW